MFKDIFKNKAALAIMGGALALIITLVLVFVFLSGGTALAGGGRAGGSGSSMAFAPNQGGVEPPAQTDAPEETEAPEATPAPTPAPTPEPTPTPTPQPTPEPTPAGEVFHSEQLGFFMILPEGMTAEENAENSEVLLYIDGIQIGFVMFRPGAEASDMLDDEHEFDNFLEWSNASTGTDEIGEIRTADELGIGPYTARYVSLELMTGGKIVYIQFNWFVDAQDGFYHFMYQALPDYNTEEGEKIDRAWESFVMEPRDGPQASPEPDDDLSSFENEIWGYSVRFPSSFKPEFFDDTANPVSFMYERNADIGVDIQVYEGTDIQDIHEATMLEEWYSEPEFGIELVDQQMITRGNYEYGMLKYEFMIEDEFVYWRYVVAVKGRMYVVSAGCPVGYEDQMPEITDYWLNSLVVTR